MIETSRLKILVILFQTIISFVTSKNVMNIYNDLAWKHGNVTVKNFRKYEYLIIWISKLVKGWGSIKIFTSSNCTFICFYDFSPANAFPNSTDRNQPFCSVVSFLIVSLIPCISNPDSSIDYNLHFFIQNYWCCCAWSLNFLLNSCICCWHSCR